jgi:hypothetical protein
MRAASSVASAESIFSLFHFSAHFAYREALADWPEPWRKRWGLRANALEESGLRWRDAETRAFVEVLHERHSEGDHAALLVVTSVLE